MIPIDDDIPLPAKGGGRPRSFPFDEMTVGQSFFVPGRRSISGQRLSRAKKRTGFSFAQRAVVENGVAGLRVWRTA